LTRQTTSRPLIGLTATPFRGASSEEETRRLVNRFGANRFDIGVIPGDDPYPVLQERGILARVDHQLLDGGTLSLSADEPDHLETFRQLPRSAEARLGANRERSQRIVDSVRQLPADWPVLIFGTSVDQSNLLAALLSIAGVPTQVISGETDAGARRHYVEEFKRGRLRVLTNYGVLTTGFDAPAIRALYVARPVYSPVLYQQMIGRGLRGPANGGKDRCLIVNVGDNIAQYGHQLAFRHFDHLWNQ
jgi:superfamily II DNA or RNA helicase